MQALIYLPHCVASILSYVTLDPHEYLMMVLRVLGSDNKEIYEIYSREVRKRFATTTRFRSMTAYLRRQCMRDDVDEISAIINTTQIDICFIVENADKIIDLYYYPRCVDMYFKMGDECFTVESLSPGRYINYAKFKNLKKIDTGYWNKSIEDTNVETLYIDNTLPSSAVLPKTIRVAKLNPDRMVPENATMVRNDGTIRPGTTHILRSTTIGPKSDILLQHNINPAWFAAPFSADLQSTLLVFDVVLGEIRMTIKRHRVDGTMLPTITDGISFNEIDFGSVTSQSIYHCACKYRYYAEGSTLSLPPATDALEILNIKNCNVVNCHGPLRYLKKLGISEPKHLAQLSSGTLTRLKIELRVKYAGEIVIDEPSLHTLVLKYVNVEKVRIVNCGAIHRAVFWYHKAYMRAEQIIRNMFGPERHYTKSRNLFKNITFLDVNKSYTSYVVEPDPRYKYYYNDDINAQYAVINDVDLFNKIKDHYHEAITPADPDIFDKAISDLHRSVDYDEYINEIE